MPLILSKRHSARDLEQWSLCERLDAVNAKRLPLPQMILRATNEMGDFARRVGGCYAGTSWGKDSSVLAHLCYLLQAEHGIIIPVVWVKVLPIANPDCALVRDAFLAQHPLANYHEIEVWCAHDADGWHARGTLEKGFAQAAKQFDARHISGIRGAESGPRKHRMMTYGVSSENTCAPIGWWSTPEVYAYLYQYKLPVHPAYACSQGGIWHRDRIRVASLGGKRGQGHGRAEWEMYYYGKEVRALEET